MSVQQYGELGDTFYFWFATNSTAGSGVDPTSLTNVVDVRLAGAAASAAPVVSLTPYILTHANYAPGLLEVQVDATSGAGFASNNSYAVFTTATADSQTPVAFIGSFSLGKLATASDYGLLVESAITSISTTTKFVLTTGSDLDDEYNGLVIALEDADNVNRQTIRRVVNYIGSTKEVEIDAATVGWTFGTSDKARIYASFHADATNSDVTAVKAKTDQLTFSASSQVDANVTSVNENSVGGTGAVGDRWGPA